MNEKMYEDKMPNALFNPTKDLALAMVVTDMKEDNNTASLATICVLIDLYCTLTHQKTSKVMKTLVAAVDDAVESGLVD